MISIFLTILVLTVSINAQHYQSNSRFKVPQQQTNFVAPAPAQPTINREGFLNNNGIYQGAFNTGPFPIVQGVPYGGGSSFFSQQPQGTFDQRYPRNKG